MNGAAHDSIPLTNGDQAHAKPTADIQRDASKLEDDLPVFELSQVSLALLVHRTAGEIFKDLLTLAEILPSMSDVRRKYAILEFAGHAGRKLLRLAVLSRFAQHSPVLQKCTNLSGFLTLQNEQFEHTTTHLESIQRDLSNARVRNYDLPTAMDLLTVGKYTRLPSVLKDFALPLRTPDDQVLGILHELDRTLQLRLAVHDQIPKAMLKYEIKDGKVTFKVKNTFEAVMTVAGAANDDRWYLLAVSFGVDSNLHDAQHQHIIDIGNRIISKTEEPGAAPLPARVKTLPSLYRIFSFLQSLALSYRLEKLHLETLQLIRKVGWAGNLSLDQAKDRRSFEIHYWNDAQPPKPPQNQAAAASKIAPDLVPSVHKPKIVFALEEDVAPSGSTAFLSRIEGRGSATLKSPPTRLVANHFESSSDRSRCLEIYDDSTTVESILNSLIYQHTNHLMHIIYRQLSANNGFELSDVNIVFSPEDTHLIDAFDVTILPTCIVRLSISAKTGRLHLSTQSSLGVSVDRRVRQTSKLVNESRELIADYLLRLRTTLIADDLEAKFAYLGLQPYRRPPLTPQALARFSEGQPCFVHMPKHPMHYFVIVTDGKTLRFAIARLEAAVANSRSDLEIQELGWLDAKALGVSESSQVNASQLKRLYEYSIVRITSYRIEQQLYARRIPYAHTLARPSEAKSESDEEVAAPTSLSHPSVQLRAFDVSSKLQKVVHRNILIQVAFRSRSRPCRIVFSAKLMEDIIPAYNERIQDPECCLDNGILKYTTTDLDNCVESFLGVLDDLVEL